MLFRQKKSAVSPFSPRGHACDQKRNKKQSVPASSDEATLVSTTSSGPVCSVTPDAAARTSRRNETRNSLRSVPSSSSGTPLITSARRSDMEAATPAPRKSCPKHTDTRCPLTGWSVSSQSKSLPGAAELPGKKRKGDAGAAIEFF